METLALLAMLDPLFQVTRTKLVHFDQPESVIAALDWWLETTGAGCDGMVVKPIYFLT